MKVQTDYGEQEIEEVIRCYNLWRKMMIKNIDRRNTYNQSEEGIEKNRARAKDYYQRHREEILEKRKQYNETKRNQENH